MLVDWGYQSNTTSLGVTIGSGRLVCDLINFDYLQLARPSAFEGPYKYSSIEPTEALRIPL